ncbi:unnamed protein product [Kuraishia capsulata CBS 1993]|uniref:SCA7 domain-containing protein n=1 Tax=Kuraishia capsulata CBS 1993 TaxID=1382522 RepID=W6MX97_9ASCO|nr:uncharacterized protein KUCA_T00004493001 [Kuraishia capsulata CBS 1993]CDK28510.1 unnamed protein product [Kuraishia capsulata CBS 1993]
MSKRPPSISERALSDALGPSIDKKISALGHSASTDSSKVKIWKDLGQYLETLQGVPSESNSGPAFVKNPLSSPVPYRICNHCDRPFLETHMAAHIESCMRSSSNSANSAKSRVPKKRRLEAEFEAKENTPVPPEHPPKGKKAKAVKEKKRKKEKTKPSSKEKGPVDVEKQCGVALPNNGFCARSLTCKTHSMGAKRAVPGRSAPYDQLLAAYQRKNQAKLVAGAAAAQAAQEDMLHASSIPLDDDEETQQVLEGVMRSYPLPLERRTIMPVRSRSQFLRMREMFAGAILPRIAANPLGGLNGRTAVVDVDKVDDYYYLVRSPQRVPHQGVPRQQAGQGQPQQSQQHHSPLSGQDLAQARAQQQAQALMRARAQQAGLTPQMQQRVMSNPQVAAQRAAGIYNTQNRSTQFPQR